MIYMPLYIPIMWIDALTWTALPILFIWAINLITSWSAIFAFCWTAYKKFLSIVWWLMHTPSEWMLIYSWQVLKLMWWHIKLPFRALYWFIWALVNNP